MAFEEDPRFPSEFMDEGHNHLDSLHHDETFNDHDPYHDHDNHPLMTGLPDMVDDAVLFPGVAQHEATLQYGQDQAAESNTPIGPNSRDAADTLAQFAFRLQAPPAPHHTPSCSRNIPRQNPLPLPAPLPARVRAPCRQNAAPRSSHPPLPPSRTPTSRRGTEPAGGDAGPRGARQRRASARALEAGADAVRVSDAARGGRVRRASGAAGFLARRSYLLTRISKILPIRKKIYIILL